jgi:hypothetical protein
MKAAIFAVIATAVIASLTAATPLTNTAFAKCGLGTQDIHCSGQNPPFQGASAGNFKCDLSAHECAFSGNSALGGGHCTTNLFTNCVGQLSH